MERVQKYPTENYTCETVMDLGVFEQKWELSVR